MTFDLNKAEEILRQTPVTVKNLLSDLSVEWINNNEGEKTWSPFDIIGHLIHGEKTDWIPRMQIILSDSGNHEFEVFDRFAQFENSKGKSLSDLLDEFDLLRQKNLERLRSMQLDEQQLNREGVHPEFGRVTARQLLATWVVHDLNHLSQISRVMASQYRFEVGPWAQYLGILKT